MTDATHPPRAPLWTPAFARFVEPARGRCALWRLALGIVVIGLCWAATSVLPFIGLAALEASGRFDTAAFQASLLAGTSPGGTLLILGGFAGLAGGTMLAAKLLHGRAPRSLFGHGQAGPFLVGLGAVLIVSVAGLLLPSELETTPNLSPQRFVLFLGPALVLLALQTGAEELAFRGYLQSQLAARFRSPVVWLLLPGALFGALHWSPGTWGENAPMVVAATTLVGWLAADLTRVSGGIGAAWGLHLGNNAGAVLAVGMPGPLGGLAPFHHATDPADPVLGPLMLWQIGFLLLAWALIRLWLSRRAPVPA